MQTIHVLLSQLVASKSNVRASAGADENISALAASIEVHGLLQSPVVKLVAPKKGKAKADALPTYEVVAGRRRHLAMQHLVAHDLWSPDTSIDVTLLDDGASVAEVSMAENSARSMTPVQVYLGIKEIITRDPSLTPEQLGASFGYDAPRTGRILRLVNLAPPVLDAYVLGKLSDAQAQAFAATTDHALQLAVFNQIEPVLDRNSWQSEPRNIRELLGTSNRNHMKDLQTVGLDVYLAAGGQFDQDLFSDKNEGIVLDPDLLARLMLEHRSAARAAFLATCPGVSFADGRPAGKYGTDYELRYTPDAMPTDEQRARLDAIDAREREIEDIDDSELDEEEQDRLYLELQTLNRETAAILAATPKAEMPTGLVAVEHTDYNNVTTYELWFPNRAAYYQVYPDRAPKVRDAPTFPQHAPDDPVDAIKNAGFTQIAFDNLKRFNRDILRQQMMVSAMMDSAITIDFLLFTQARNLVGNPKEGTGAWGHGSVAAAGAENMRDQPVISQWAAYEKRVEDMPCFSGNIITGFDLFRQLPDDDKRFIAGYIAAHNLPSMLNAAHNRNPLLDHVALLIEDAFPNETAGALVKRDAMFFDHLSGKMKKELLTRFGQGERIKTMKARDLTAFCVRCFNAEEVDRDLLGIDDETFGEMQNWLPDVLHRQRQEPPAPVVERTMADNEDQDDALLAEIDETVTATPEQIAEEAAQRKADGIAAALEDARLHHETAE